MSRALRVGVPLNTRCSRKWDEPAICGGSSREPAATQMPRVTDRTPGMRSVTTRSPDSNSVRTISAGPRRGDDRAFRAVGERAVPRRTGRLAVSVLPVAAVPPAIPVARPTPDPSVTVAGAVAALASLESAVALLAWPPTLRRVPSLAHGLQGDPSPVRFDVLDLDRELVALLDGLLDAVQAPAPAELRDVHQTVGAREDVHERSEVRGLHHGSFVALADLGHPGVDDLLDHL